MPVTISRTYLAIATLAIVALAFGVLTWGQGAPTGTQTSLEEPSVRRRDGDPSGRRKACVPGRSDVDPEFDQPLHADR